MKIIGLKTGENLGYVSGARSKHNGESNGSDRWMGHGSGGNSFTNLNFLFLNKSSKSTVGKIRQTIVQFYRRSYSNMRR